MLMEERALRMLRRVALIGRGGVRSMARGARAAGPKAYLPACLSSPMACCVSNLKQLYARGQEFCYGIEEIARYYRTYLELMCHWNRVLPGRVLRVSYEDLVED